MADLTVEARQIPGCSAVLLSCHGVADAHTFERLDQAITDAFGTGAVFARAGRRKMDRKGAKRA